ELVHGVQHATVDGFQPVAHVREGAPHDHAHGVIEVTAAHLVLEVDGDDFLGELGHLDSFRCGSEARRIAYGTTPRSPRHKRGILPRNATPMVTDFHAKTMICGDFARPARIPRGMAAQLGLPLAGEGLRGCRRWRLKSRPWRPQDGLAAMPLAAQAIAAMAAPTRAAVPFPQPRSAGVALAEHRLHRRRVRMLHDPLL